MREATCSKCGEGYNPHDCFFEPHDECGGTPLPESVGVVGSDFPTGCWFDDCELTICPWCNSNGCQACGWTGHTLNDEGLPYLPGYVVIAPHMPALLAQDVSTMEGVRAFLTAIHTKLNIAWHPDTPADDIVWDDGELLFTKGECTELDDKWSVCFSTCEAAGADIYGVALDIYTQGEKA